MATCCLPLPPSIKLQWQHQPASSSSLIYCHRSLQLSNFKPRSLCGRCRATSPGPPPESGPNSNKPPAPSSGVAASFTRFQDTIMTDQTKDLDLENNSNYRWSQLGNAIPDICKY
ncbi:unnamed protein product [Fraxinus pennsylvanica]|uniref:Uncharacterized protein n=1 Tax=Fraxinus pennsylvanica TaxID=56036 RepID=A0AAD2AF04_9LAMI|nr:unnamed protein product [Fraxinus pennsylvanica]